MGNKITRVIIEAPVESYSFFGSKSRQLIKAIKKIHPDWIVSIYNYFEDNTRAGFIDNDIENLIITRSEEHHPDVWIQVGHPSIFYRKGVKNIGVTTSYIYYPVDLFIGGCNNMDVIWTFSQYSIDTMSMLHYETNDGSVVRINTSFVLLPEYPLLNKEQDGHDLLKDIDTDWNFLVEGYWEATDGQDFGGNNKDNIGFIIRTFLSTFVDTDLNIGLILNVHGDISSILDKTRLSEKINNIRTSIPYDISLPKIYLINADLSDDALYDLYNNDKIKALISIPQRSDSVQNELNFAFTSGKPIIYTNFAAQRDSLSYKGNLFIGGNTKQINTFGVTVIDSFTSDLKLCMYDMYYHYQALLNKSKSSINNLTNKFNEENYLKLLDNALN